MSAVKEKTAMDLYIPKAKYAVIHGDAETDTEGLVVKVKIRPISLKFVMKIQKLINSDDEDENTAGMVLLGNDIIADWNIGSEETGEKIPPTGEELINQDTSLMSLIAERWFREIESLSKRDDEESS